METEEIELFLLKEAILQRYGHDLNSYATPSLKRRLTQAINQLGFNSISQLIPWILHDSNNYIKLLNDLSITVTEMFRDPEVFKFIRESIVPDLIIQPYSKFWIAGCATGEEAYTLAILLYEEGLLDNSLIFATDISQKAINKAREGIYNKELINSYNHNYLSGGGKHSLSEYFTFSRFSNVKIKQFIKEKIVFAQHDLTKEKEFSEVHMVMCRNVLMYFNQLSQQNIVNMFKNSLYKNGYICIGKRETLHSDNSVIVLSAENKFYQYTQNNLTEFALNIFND